MALWADRKKAKEIFSVSKDCLQEWEINRWVKVHQNKDHGKKRYCVADLNNIMTSLSLGKTPKTIIRGKNYA